MDDLGKSIPAAEGMVDAEQSVNRKAPNEFCLNCGTKLIDTFCHHCGQKDIPRRQTLGELWINFVSSFWSYEGKFFLTTKFLITRPGFLAMEYNRGKRETYFHPARMYVFISFVFFLIFFSLPEDEEKKIIQSRDDDEKEQFIDSLTSKGKVNVDSILNAVAGTDSTVKKALQQPWVDSVKKKVNKNRKGKINWNLSKTEYKTRESYDSAQSLLPEAKRDGWFKKRMTQRWIDLNSRFRDDPNAFGKEFGKAFTDNFSKILFYLLPFFALILKLLYVRRDYFYSEHLVFSIYYYNFFYFAGSIQMLVNLIPWLSWVGTLIGFWIFFYLLFAMKRMYQQSWRKTILKFFIFTFVFFFFACMALVMNAMFIIMMI
ncbi:MAG TPA: DUF3667 domain-containing protein [Cyclobacteriaceae bacterium]|nr:DUF3667 domain-containing protein [Cyclobacteriaceae bacterium]